MPSTITTPNTIIGFLPDGQPVYEIRGGAPAPDEDPAPPAGTPADPPAENPPAEDGDDDDKDFDIERAKAERKRARAEAAGWRAQLREAQEALGKAKSPEDYAAAVADFEAKIQAKDDELFATRREVVIAQHKLPADLAALLPEKGKTLEELETLAKGLAKYAPADDDDTEGDGGLTPGASGRSATDPASLAKQARSNRPRFR